VEVTVLGEFTDDGKFHILYDGKTVALLDIEFMHQGLPRLTLNASWKKPEWEEPADLNKRNMAKDLPEITLDTPEIPGMEILHLPGHTPGGAGFYFPADSVLFAGDTLFADSVGRTDLPGGDWDQLKNSIRQKIFTLPDEVKVYCGHGPATTVGHEKKHNPYL
jgi:glyoxylase-like metal-dependent hydrolase (beta-lactamase superfamily II)